MSGDCGAIVAGETELKTVPDGLATRIENCDKSLDW